MAEDSSLAAEQNDTKASENKDGTVRPKPQQKKRKKRTAGYYMAELAVKLIMTALMIRLLLTYVAGVYVNHTNSSYPMIKDGDLCLTYKLGQVKQGDVIAYEQGEEIRFGRAVAFAGDTVEIKDDYVAVNGYGIFEETVYPTTAEGSAVSYPYTVPENSVFVLNDLRSDITDSRTLGAVSLEEFKGKVVFIMRRRGI